MFKNSRIKISALGALVFGFAMSVGAFATGGCWACHTACDDNRIACVAAGGGNCMKSYKLCVRDCATNIPNCPIP
jgi:hypothetical protein